MDRVGEEGRQVEGVGEGSRVGAVTAAPWHVCAAALRYPLSSP